MAQNLQPAVSRRDVDGMRIGETRSILLPNYRKIKSGMQNLRNYGKEEGKKYTFRVDEQNNILTVTRID